jgi:hypothetical protein
MAFSDKASKARPRQYDPSGFIGVAGSWQDRQCPCMLIISSFPILATRRGIRRFYLIYGKSDAHALSPYCHPVGRPP